MTMQSILAAVLLFAAAASALNLPKNVDYLGALDHHVAESRVSFPPSCTPFYPSMSHIPKGSDSLAAVYGVCVNLHTGNFVAVALAGFTYFHIYSESGLKIKKVPYPAPYGLKVDCVYTKDNIYISDMTFKKILKYSADGTYQGEFAIGEAFFRMTYGGDYLYSTIYLTNFVHVYNIHTHSRKLVFQITSTLVTIRGIAMDSKKNLYITALNKVVEKYTYDGHRLGQTIYPELTYGDGIAIDGSDNIIIADHLAKVLVYNQNNLLLKKFYPVLAPADVAVSADCSNLIVAATGAAKVLLL